MIVVRSSSVIDVPMEHVGRLWGQYVLQRLTDRGFAPDEWLQKDNAEGVTAEGDVVFEAVSAARTRVTLSVRLDLQPGDEGAGAQVDEAYGREQRHLGRFRDFAEARLA